MKFIFTFLSVFVLFFTTELFSQNEKPVGQPAATEVINTPVPDPQISEIVKHISEAKLNNDIISKQFWETKLNEITKPQVINGSDDQFTFRKEMKEIPASTSGLSVYLVGSGTIIANSISRDRVSGDLYAALGCLANPNSDTLKILRSTNNGVSFTLLISVASPGFKITFNSIDVEAVSKGDSSFAFVSFAYTLSSGFYYSGIIRVRQDGGQASSAIIPGTATNKYIFPRVTSDNSVYTVSTYIYFSTTLDSNSGSGRKLLSKFYKILSPFAPTMSLTSGYINPANNAYGFYVSGTSPDTATFESDIAYLHTTAGGDQIYTVTVVRGVPGFFTDGTGLYFTRTTDYGATVPTIFNTTDAPYLKDSPRIATTGYQNNSIMVVTRRLFGGGDWDSYYFTSADITVASPVFTKGYVSTSTDTTLAVSVAGRQRSNGSYLFGYSNRNGSTGQAKIYIAPFTTGSLSSVQVNPSNIAAYGLGSPNVTFRNVNNDSCLVIWGSGVNGSYTTGGCSGPFIGVNNNSTVVNEFELKQNYPNPFNPSTNISFTMPSKAFVNVTVYDVLGNELATVVNEYKNEGYYIVGFNAKNLASGVYYYKITFTTNDSKSFTQTRKMILMK